MNPFRRTMSSRMVRTGGILLTIGIGLTVGGSPWAATVNDPFEIMLRLGTAFGGAGVALITWAFISIAKGDME